MTKEKLAKLMIETVECYQGEEQIKGVLDLLNTLTPKDRKKFAQWGLLFEKSTEEDCWD